MCMKKSFLFIFAAPKQNPGRSMKKNILLFLCILSIHSAWSQKKIVRHGSFYLSWGYNTEWYTHSNIHVAQPDQNSNYQFMNVVATDHRGWDDHLLQKQLTIPQYNYRLGYFFNEKQDWGFEINFDHTKYVVTPGQSVRVKGTIKGRSVDTVVVTTPDVLIWYLNNGANFLQFNLVKKIKIIDKSNSNVQFDCLLKAGIGPVIPHVQNTIFGVENDPHFQFGGYNIDADVSFRGTFLKHVFLEFQSKAVYGQYFGLRLGDGMGDQHFGCFEIALVLGATFHL
jgi:hypothetical protein